MQGFPYIPFDEEYYQNNLYAEPEELAKKALTSIRANSEAGGMDPLTNLADSAAYIYAGKYDDVAPPNLQQAVALNYKELGMDPDRIKFELDEETGHDFGEYKPAIALNWVLKTLGFIKDFEWPINPWQNGTTYEFDQEKIVKSIGESLESTKMRKVGKVYVPDSCEYQ